jgi:hypothetical protein
MPTQLDRHDKKARSAGGRSPRSDGGAQTRLSRHESCLVTQQACSSPYTKRPAFRKPEGQPGSTSVVFNHERAYRSWPDRGTVPLAGSGRRCCGGSDVV